MPASSLGSRRSAWPPRTSTRGWALSPQVSFVSGLPGLSVLCFDVCSWGLGDGGFVPGLFAGCRLHLSWPPTRALCRAGAAANGAVDKQQLIADVRAALYSAKVGAGGQAGAGIGVPRPQLDCSWGCDAGLWFVPHPVLKSNAIPAALSPAHLPPLTLQTSSYAQGCNHHPRTHSFPTLLPSTPPPPPTPPGLQICSYAQGYNIIRAKSQELGWGVDLGGLARIWKGGCIIRAGFLDRIKKAYQVGRGPRTCVGSHQGLMWGSHRSLGGGVAQPALASLCGPLRGRGVLGNARGAAPTSA